MSLSFVSSAVLSSSDGVSHNEEKPIESKEVDALRTQQQHKPLFEQLRSNQEKQEAEHEELQRQIMRGTLALDEEDVAHLETLRREKEKREQQVKTEMDEELALFRAAKTARAQADLVVDDEDDDGEEKEENEEETKEVVGTEKKITAEPKKAPMVPKFAVKRRREQAVGLEEAPSKNQNKGHSVNDENWSTSEAKTNDKPKGTGGLNSLLGAYGSSADDSD